MTALIEEPAASPTLTQAVCDQLHRLFGGLPWTWSILGHSHVVCLGNGNLLAADTQPAGMAELRRQRSRCWCDGGRTARACGPPSAWEQGVAG